MHIYIYTHTQGEREREKELIPVLGLLGDAESLCIGINVRKLFFFFIPITGTE
jgi:hypothetical protein